MDFKRKGRSRRLMLQEVSLTPLIDVALTLLVIFMITTPMLQDSIKLSLPETKHGQGDVLQQKSEPLVVSIDKQGTLFFVDKEVKLADLPRVIKNAVKNKPNSVVMVKGDRALVYDRIIQVVDSLQGIEGIKHVALAAKRIA